MSAQARHVAACHGLVVPRLESRGRAKQGVAWQARQDAASFRYAGNDSVRLGRRREAPRDLVVRREVS